MRRIRVMGLCLVAVVASAVFAASASAEPEFVTKAVVGEAVSSVPFSGTIGPSYWESASLTKITCTSGAVVGEVTGPKSLANIVLTLQGCETAGGKVQTTGMPEGTVVTKTLAGILGGITSSLPGIKLYSQAEGKGGVVLEANSNGAVLITWKGEVTGSLAGAAGENPATGKLLSSFKLSLTQTKGAIQKYKGFSEGEEAGLLGQLLTSVNGGAFELDGWFIQPVIRTMPSTWGLGITK
jgi:hypothetical protein